MKLRERLGKVSDEELVKFGKAARIQTASANWRFDKLLPEELLLEQAYSGRTYLDLPSVAARNVVACASDTHFHVLGNMEREISLRVFRPGFSSVQFFKSRDESLNPVRILLQFHLNPPGRRIIITSAGQRPVNEPRRVGPAQHAVCTKRRTCSRSEYAIWQDRSLSVGDDVRIRT